MKIGLVVHQMQESETAVAPAYVAMRAMAQTAERGGLDSIWLFDHLLFRFPEQSTRGIWECWTMLSALAEATSRVELGTLVMASPFRNPALLAKMAHTLDEISGGRLILGLGAGWHRPEFDAFGYKSGRLVGRLEQALQILHPLLKGESIEFNGTDYQVKAAVVTPLGPRPGGIPLLIGARGPRMLRLVARFADQWNMAWLDDPAELSGPLERLHIACDREGRDPATVEVTAGIQVCFPDLGVENPWSRHPLSGPAERLAEVFRGYDEAGTAHLIININSTSIPAVERVAEAARRYRDATP